MVLTGAMWPVREWGHCWWALVHVVTSKSSTEIEVAAISTSAPTFEVGLMVTFKLVSVLSTTA